MTILLLIASLLVILAGFAVLLHSFFYAEEGCEDESGYHSIAYAHASSEPELVCYAGETPAPSKGKSERFEDALVH
jgi:hypothetical protein